MRSNALATLTILEAANVAGLPEPMIVSFDDTNAEIAVHLYTLADITEWALRLDAPVNDSILSNGSAHHCINTEWLEVPLRIVVIERAVQAVLA